MNRSHGFDRFKNSIIRDKYGGNVAFFTGEDARRLKAGEPADYIIGWSPFLDVEIDLSKRPLIPRPETEYWVKQAIEEIEISAGSRNARFSALDIFAGSGCIGIALLKHFPDIAVDFADIDPVMAEQIKINLKKNGVEARARIIHSDGFKKIKYTKPFVSTSLGRNESLFSFHSSLVEIKKKYDFIFANPPYVSAREMEKLPKSVKDFEPHGALFGGENGLKIIERFLSEAKQFLKKDGAVYVEFGSGQKEAVGKIAKKADWSKVEFFKDQYKIWRWVRCK